MPSENFVYEGSTGSDAFHSWNINYCAFVPPYGYELDLRDGWARYGSIYKYVDLRGINRIEWDWSNSGDLDDKSVRSGIQIGPGIDYSRGNAFDIQTDWAGDGSGIGKFPREQTYIRFYGKTEWNHHGKLTVYEVRLYKQKFDIYVRQPDSMYFDTYDGAGQPVQRTAFNPGTVVLSNTSPYRDETVTLTPSLSQDGIKRGARYVGYRIVYPGGGASDIIYSNTIALTPDFISTYIYGHGGSNWYEALTIQPVFERMNAGDFRILDYDNSQGKLKIGGVEYKNQTIEVAGRKIGDLMQVECVPADGYTANGVKAYTKTASGYEQKDYGIAASIEFSQETKVEPVFQRDNNTVLIKWKAPATGTVEAEATNRARGVILHDRPDHMPPAEYNVLFNGVNSSDSASVREARIRQNYAAYRQQFSTYTIKEAAVGDIITLYAKPDPGYTVRWWTNVAADTGTVISESDVTKALPHIGSSFSFEVTSDLQNVYYYFTPVNTAGNSIFAGKIIRSLNTIKRQSAFAVDINNPNTYVGVPGVSVSVAVADSNDLYTTVDGRRYGTTAVSDADGNFKLYVPYGVPDALYSVKLLNGERVLVKSILVNNRMFLEIPFMDELKVRDMQVSGVVSDSTTITIEDRQATLSIIATSDNNRRISKARLRSYDGTGALWQTLDAAYDGLKWNLTTNLRETLKNNGRLTVELYDEKGIGYGEIDTGYALYEPPADGDVAMPDIPILGEPHNVDVVGEVQPSTSLGTSRNKRPQPASEGSKTYTIAVGPGEVLKQVVAENSRDFDNQTIANKMAILAS